MKRAYYTSDISNFCDEDPKTVLGAIVQQNEFSLLATQRDAWLEQAYHLQSLLRSYSGRIYFEFSIPRMGRRIDVVLIISGVVFVVEYKVGASAFYVGDIDQVTDYALDLQNFHEGSHEAYLVPILVSTEATASYPVEAPAEGSRLFSTINCASEDLDKVIRRALSLVGSDGVDFELWEASGYRPTPTIIEATLALYAGHGVTDISRNDAGATNLRQTSTTVSEIVIRSRRESKKSIVFVTGVPGAGKTLVGLDVASQHLDEKDDLYSVFLSGNGPLVSILQEALARDKVARSRSDGSTAKPMKIGTARSEVKALIQNVHHFRDDCLAAIGTAPVEHVAIFDEAQRAWDAAQTIDFMKRKKGVLDFSQSEPEFLVSCLDRHQDWAVVVCLIGGGQEINKGEAGIAGWLDAVEKSFPHWDVYASDRLVDSEYGGPETVEKIGDIPNSSVKPQLHLETSMRSFRSEKVSLFVKQLLDLEESSARATLLQLHDKYPVVLTRDLARARSWMKENARGSERYGIMVSSQAERLRPLGVHVKAPLNPVTWFLNGKDHVHSSYYCEDVATEFHVQGLELDWACLVWDADFRHDADGWEHWSFRGSKWQQIKKLERRTYQKNAYRVLLTRARQGMVVVVPEGDDADFTRPASYYDRTYDYLANVGLEVLD